MTFPVLLYNHNDPKISPVNSRLSSVHLDHFNFSTSSTTNMKLSAIALVAIMAISSTSATPTCEECIFAMGQFLHLFSPYQDAISRVAMPKAALRCPPPLFWKEYPGPPSPPPNYICKRKIFCLKISFNPLDALVALVALLTEKKEKIKKFPSTLKAL